MPKKVNLSPYEILFNLVSDGIIILHQTKVIACNDILLGWLGYTNEKLVGSDLSELLEPEDRSLVQELESLQRSKTTSMSQHTFSLQHNDQKSKISVQAKVCMLAQGEWSDHCVMTLTNVTKDKLFQKLMDSSQQRLQEVIETFPDIYYVTDAQGVILKVSPSVKEILGYEPHELLGTPILKYYQKPELRDLIFAEVVAAKGKYVRIEGALLHKSGHPVWFNTRARILFDSDGNVAGLEGLSRDSTIEKNTQEIIENNKKKLLAVKNSLEEKVKEQTQELLQKERLWFQQSRHAQMGEMISAIAHQWRQPLFALSMWVDNISILNEKNNLQKEDLKKFSEKAHGLIQYMSKTIDEFKNFFKPQSEMNVFNVGQAITGATDLIKASLIQENVSFEFNNFQNACVEGYQNEFGQVIINLLTNAKESLLQRNTPKPKITVNLDIQNQNAVIEVSDNSGGISPKIIDKIFDPYFTTKKFGTGIGLYMSKSIVEKNMKGQITVANTASGAIFKITIPLYKFTEECPQCSITKSAVSCKSKMDNKTEQTRLAHLRILFIDDCEDTREIFSLMLKNNGAAIKTVGSSKECLQILPEFKPDLIISDISMPEEDGFSLIKKIRALEKEKHIPAIALSAHIDEEQIQYALKVGFQRYIKKPTDWKALARMILELTEDSQNL